MIHTVSTEVPNTVLKAGENPQDQSRQRSNDGNMAV